MLTEHQKRIAGELAEKKQELNEAIAAFNIARKALMDNVIMIPCQKMNMREIEVAVAAMSEKQALINTLVDMIVEYNAELGIKNDPDLLKLKYES